MDEDIKTAPTFPIGNKKYFCIEYPGNVKNVNRALETIGGEKAVAQFYESVKKNQNKKELSYIHPIELRYRPNDPYSHPIEGSVAATPRVLLKVTRRRKKNQPEEEAEMKTDVLGVIPYTCRFRNMADFQYIVPKSNRIHQLRTSVLSGNVKNIMNYEPRLDDDKNDLEGIPPPVFSTLNTPFKYDYKQNSGVVRVRLEQPDGTYVTKLVTRKSYSPISIAYAKFENESIPKEPNNNLPPLDPKTLAVKEKLLKFFEERPVWLRVALRSRLDVSERMYLVKALSYIAYSFSNGPWRECWIKFGLDVRQDNKYNIYQQIDIRTTTGHGAKYLRGRRRAINPLVMTEQEKVNNEAEDSNTEIKYKFDGKELITGTSTFQLCDITDPDFAGLINNPKYLLSVPTKKTGYYYESVTRVIRNSLKKKHEQLMEKGYADRIENMEAGLDKKIKRDLLKMVQKEGVAIKPEMIGEMDSESGYKNDNIEGVEDEDDDDEDEDEDEDEESEDEEMVEVTEIDTNIGDDHDQDEDDDEGDDDDEDRRMDWE